MVLQVQNIQNLFSLYSSSQYESGECRQNMAKILVKGGNTV